MNNTELPFISIVLPVYNAQKTLAKCLDSLLAQDYPKDSFEIIAVDNGSLDSSLQILQKYPIKVLEEKEVQSSYAARNEGIRAAKGEIVAFIDSDCVAKANWLSEGVQVIYEQNADLAGGKVEFVFSPRKTLAEIYDAVMNIRMEFDVVCSGVCPTANLFVRKEVFVQMGQFPEDVKSGGDTQWTRNATQAGKKLVFVPNAIVEHPTRQLGELLRKSFRVGTGKMPYILGQREPWEWKAKNIFYVFMPRKISTIKECVAQSGLPEAQKRWFALWLFNFVYSFFRAIGIIYGFLLGKR